MSCHICRFAGFTCGKCRQEIEQDRNDYLDVEEARGKSPSGSSEVYKYNTTSIVTDTSGRKR